MAKNLRCLSGTILLVFATLGLLQTPQPLASQKGSLSAPQPFDWPQWRGPERNGKSRETGFLRSWPKDLSLIHI